MVEMMEQMYVYDMQLQAIEQHGVGIEVIQF